MIIEELFCFVDDFCKTLPQILENKLIRNKKNEKSRNRKTKLSISEIMTIVLWFYQKNYKNFKSYYIEYVQYNLLTYFPDLVSYSRFIELLPRILQPMQLLLKSSYGKSTGISYVDSTSLAVCSNKRTGSHKVFKKLATIGKSSKGWFYGFKLHVTCNHKGDLLGIQFTKGKVNDLKPLSFITKTICGKLFGDKGYISKTIAEKLKEKGIVLITSIKKNMKSKLMSIEDKILLKKRSVIESIFNQLKSKFNIEHTRHRSYINALVHTISGLVAYCFYPNKASINMKDLESNRSSSTHCLPA